MSADRRQSRESPLATPPAYHGPTMTPSPAAEYAPSPNTSSLALNRANQLRVQSLLRQLLQSVITSDNADADEHNQLDTLRVLRKTLREIDYQLSWLTQVDFLETLERILVSQDESQRAIRADSRQNQSGPSRGSPSPTCRSPWRLVHDTTQLLLEALPRLSHEIAFDVVESIVPIVVENLGHLRSEVRRASLLSLNMLMREMPQNFQPILRLFIDFGLTNYRNPQAQRGAILSLPLIVSQTIVEREDLAPLVRCLGALLVDDSEKNEQLFYSIYLALQRLHMMMGDKRFAALASSQCEPEAIQLYKQAASRHNSLAIVNGGSGGSGGQQAAGSSAGLTSEAAALRQQHSQELAGSGRSPDGSTSSSSPPISVLHRDTGSRVPVEQQRQQQHVTFEGDAAEENQQPSVRESGGDNDGASLQEAHRQQADQRPTSAGSGRRSAGSGNSPARSSLSSSLDSSGNHVFSGQQEYQSKQQHQSWSSDVSSTCSSDAHLVNPAHYMTKAALEGNPLDNYEQIHHIDHSNVTSLAINDFGPICNTPTIEVNPKLNYLTSIRGFGGASPSNHLMSTSPMSPAGGGPILHDDALSRHELKFGILPRQLITIALNGALRSADRYEAMQELMCIVRESPINHLAILMTYFDSFLEQFISKLIIQSPSGTANSQQRQQTTPTQQANGQTNLKLTLSAIDMLETIVVKTKVSTMQYIRPIVSLMLKSLGSQGSTGSTSTSSLLRENACRVLHKMMAYLPPQHVIDAIFEHKHHKSALVREESINRVTAAILDYDRNEFNLTKLCYHVLPMLADVDQNVRMASLECIATLAHILGPDRIGSLLTAAEAVQANCDYDGLLDSINARLQRHTLPRLCQSNGLIKYVIKPFLYGASAQLANAETEDERKAIVAADIRWVLEAPSSHQHSSGPYYHPHAHHDHSHAHAKQASPNQAAPGPDHPHHRLGVYSPPTLAERRRRSSIGLIGHLTESATDDSHGEEGAHNHHHHHHHQQATESEDAQHKAGLAKFETQRRPSCSSQQKKTRRQSIRDDEQDDTGVSRNQSEIRAVKGEHGSSNEQRLLVDRRKSCSQANVSKDEVGPQLVRSSSSLPNEQEIGKASNVRHQEAERQAPCELSQASGNDRNPSRGPINSRRKSEQRNMSSVEKVSDSVDVAQQRATRQQSKRSNSQDSLNSTDTNKMLFQYYLGKFKQSLAESPVAKPDYQQHALLPSDSIIYADVNEAYALSRHQSRYQQTSFESMQRPFHDDEFVSRSGATRIVPQEPPTVRQQQQQVEQRSVNKRPVGILQRSQATVDDELNYQEAREAREAAMNTIREVEERRQSQAARRESNTNQLRRQQSVSHERPADQQDLRDQQARQQVRPDAADERHNHQQRRKSSIGDRDASEPASLSHHSSSRQQQQQLRRKSVNLSSGSSDRDATCRSASKRTPPPEVGLVSLQRNGSDTTVSDMSSTEIVLSPPQKQVAAEGDRQTNRSAEHQRADEEPSSENVLSSSGRLHRSITRTQMIEDASEVNPEAEEAKRVRRRASRSQPPPIVCRHVEQEADSPQPPSRRSHESDARDEPAPFKTAQQKKRASQGSDHLSSSSGEQRAATTATTKKPGRRAVSVSPSLSNSVNIRHILENVANIEGRFADPSLAYKVALDALESPCWSAKVEGILALIRLAAYHQEQLLQPSSRTHEVVLKLTFEISNLRSTVARSAIFALGDFCAKLKRFIEPEMDLIVKALLQKSVENTAFIRDDLKRAFAEMVDNLTPWRLANSLITHGASHKSANVRRMASQFLAQLVAERLGPAKCLVGSREISAALLPAACKFAQDNSPQTRYYGRLILSKLMNHNSFDRLLRRHVSSSQYRSTVGIIESIKRRGPGELPQID